MNTIARLFLSAVMILLGYQANAILTVHVSQGIDKPFPIAIVPMAEHAIKNRQLPLGFTKVISNDLRQSGRFKVATDALPQSVHDLKNFKPDTWRGKLPNIEYVLLGQIKKTTKGYDVSYALVSVFADRPLIGQAYHDIAASQLRALAHHIADQVFYTITGTKGIFSTRLAYVNVIDPESAKPHYQLIVADADGFNPQVLMDTHGIPIASPQWSPDGQQIAYVSYQNNRMGIFTIRAATGQRKLLAYFPGMNSAPAWSPNGKQMAMALSRGRGANTQIYVMNIATGKLIQYTTFGNNTSPIWMPNGQSLIFNSNRSGRPQLYQLNLSTREVHRLTYDGVQNFDPAVTPNGNTLVFMHQESASSPIQIAKYQFDSGNIQVISHGQLDKSPSVAPNGRMVIYANYDRPHGVLAEVSLDGKIHLTLPATHGSVQSPAWSPFN